MIWNILMAQRANFFVTVYMNTLYIIYLIEMLIHGIMGSPEPD